MDAAYPKRKPLRIPNYDYSLCNAYFLTLCTKNREPLFWSVGATCGRPLEQPPLSDLGQIAASEIEKIHTIYPSVFVEASCVMPDHIHLLLVILAGADGRPQVAPTISRVIQQFKGSVTKQSGKPLWQKSFYDHVIRNDEDYLACWQYIEQNPMKLQVNNHVCR